MSQLKIERNVVELNSYVCVCVYICTYIYIYIYIYIYTELRVMEISRLFTIFYYMGPNSFSIIRNVWTKRLGFSGHSL